MCSPTTMAIAPRNSDGGIISGRCRVDELTQLRSRTTFGAPGTTDYPSGVCNISEGWKQQQFRAGNLQELTNPRINLAQQKLWTHANIPFYDTRVDVRKVDPEEATP